MEPFLKAAIVQYSDLLKCFKDTIPFIGDESVQYKAIQDIRRLEGGLEYLKELAKDAAFQ